MITGSSIHDNYSKGRIVDYNKSSIGLLVFQIDDKALIKNNYVANEVVEHKTSAVYIIRKINSNINSLPLSKNYYLIDESHWLLDNSLPKIGVTIDGIIGENLSTTFTFVNNNMIEEISSANLSAQALFKEESSWNFSEIWVYIKDVNWDYPVLQAIYGAGALKEIEVTIYNPHLYSDSKVQLGNVSIGTIDPMNMISMLTLDANGNVISEYGEITDSIYPGIKVLTFTYSIMASTLTDILVNKTNNGLISSVLFGARNTELTSEENMANYEEFADASNNDVHISQELTYDTYGLVVTFNYRYFEVEINTSFTAEEGTEDVHENDFVTFVLAHKDSNGNIDYAYSIDMRNTEKYVFKNVLDGTYMLYIYYPMFYINDSTTIIEAINSSNNPTLIRNDDYLNYDTITSINNSGVNYNYLGSFTLDTILRELTINVSIEKSLEYWLHGSTSNM